MTCLVWRCERSAPSSAAISVCSTRAPTEGSLSAHLVTVGAAAVLMNTLPLPRIYFTRSPVASESAVVDVSYRNSVTQRIPCEESGTLPFPLGLGFKRLSEAWIQALSG